MRPALISLVPMLAAAILVMCGGERMARRQIETRTPIDRERLFDFDKSLREEIKRLDTLYESLLGQLVETISTEKMSHSKAREKLSDTAGVLQIQTFPASGIGKKFDVEINPPRLPEIIIGKAKLPQQPEFAIILDPEFRSDMLPWTGEWRTSPMSSIMVFLVPMREDGFAAVMIDREKVINATQVHLTKWLESPIKPLREAKERIRIVDPMRQPLMTTGPDHFGPTAAILPIRSFSGSWQIEAWDGVTTYTMRDTSVMVVTTGLALLLVISGILLYFQQRRAMLLAAERVSFVNRVSHELSTPLTNLALNLDLARDYLPDPPRTALYRLNLVSEEIQRLSRLVANVLTFSRKEREAIHLQPTSCIPNKIVADTIASFRPALERRGIIIETELEAVQPALLDPDALSQIIGNLISNVEKYGASGQWIRLTARQKNERLEIVVKDRGPGIPSAARKRIFAPFARVHQGVNEGSSGTGLGLTIARELARLMSGDLELLDDEPGCTFLLRIPATSAPKHKYSETL